MKVIKPETIDSSSGRLTSSTVLEPSAGETAWVSGSGYVLGDKVIRTSVNKKYECILDITAASAISSATPEVNAVSSVPNWVEVSSTNKWAMFDTLRSTVTTASTTMTVVLTMGKSVNSLALLGMINVRYIIVSITRPGPGLVYNETYDLLRRNTTGYYGYFFGRLNTSPSLMLFDIPTDSDCEITIQFQGTEMQVGGCVLGTAQTVGTIQSGASNDVLNFSKVERSIFGDISLTPRRNVPKTNQTLIAFKEDLNTIRALKDDLNAVPAVWCALDDDVQNEFYEALLIFGFYRTFSINIENPVWLKINLELEEV